MEPKYVLILDFFVGCLNIIKLTDEELRESEEYEDFESSFQPLRRDTDSDLTVANGWLQKIWTSIAIRTGKRQDQSVIAK